MSFNYIMLISLVNETNFFIIFIALIIVFFLLGIIIGNILSRPKKDPKESNNKKNIAEETKEKPKQTDALGRDYKENKEIQDTDQNQTQRDPRYRYYNWW